ncbi:hypothetical protein EVAR_84783_1 [Eumeta japonica]|uniref:Uncharacterized protein n=1 Tax=Eumeta variegata TaxID=151549 RepID=A0A4C1U832_EUMVA|nr:hypothetical protein EVAR_84783_1 [Eumeta japonica]
MPIHNGVPNSSFIVCQRYNFGFKSTTWQRRAGQAVRTDRQTFAARHDTVYCSRHSLLFVHRRSRSPVRERLESASRDRPIYLEHSDFASPTRRQPTRRPFWLNLVFN